MIPVRHLAETKPKWLTIPETKKLFAALDPTFEKMRFVGGCVRNHLLNKPVTDFDLATSFHPSYVLELLEKADIKAVPLSLTHGTVLAVLGAYHYEITTLRRDIETDGRHAKVSYTDDWLEDAKRRDFTFNALYLSAEGELYDPWQGEEDLKKGIVRFIGEADIRIQEDYLRILRYFRFQAFYGYSTGEPKTLKACQDFAHKLKTLSAERIRIELVKLLNAPNPTNALQKMIDTKVWPVVFEGIPSESLSLFKNLMQKEYDFNLTPKAERRFALILYKESPIKIRAFLKSLKFSTKDRECIERVTAASQRVCKSINELLYYEGLYVTREALLLQMVRGYNNSLWQHLPLIWEKPIFPLKGEDLLTLGFAPSPLMGKILHHIETWWVQKDFQPNRQSCLEEVQAYVKQIQKTLNNE